MKLRNPVVALATTAILALIWGGVAAYHRVGKSEREQSHLVSAGNLALGFEESVQAILNGSDWALNQLRNRYLQNREQGGDGISALSGEALPPVAFQLAFVDPTGILRYSSLSPGTAPVDVSDREHFRVHLDPTRDFLFVSRPVFGRVSGIWSVQLTKKIVDKAGNLAGVLILSVDRRHFTDLYERIDIGERGIIALVGQDRWMRARASKLAPLTDPYATAIDDRPYFAPEAPDTGFLRLKAQYDGEDRFGAYRKVQGYPLIVAVLYSHSEMMAPFLSSLRHLAWAAGIASALVVVAALSIAIGLEKREQSLQALRSGEMEMQRLKAMLADRKAARSQRRLSQAQRMARLGTMEFAGPREVGSGPAGQWKLCPHACDLLGHPAGDGDTVMPLNRALANLAAEDLAALLRALAGFPAAGLDVEFAVSGDGGTRYLNAVGSTDGEPFLMLQDVTARRNAEKQQEQIRARVEENSRMEALGTLAAGIAHEINTPAQFVSDNLSFLESGTATLLTIARCARAAIDRPESPPELKAAIVAADLDFLEAELPLASSQALTGMERISAIVRAVKEFCYPSTKQAKDFDLNGMVRSVVTVTRNSWKYVAELDTNLDPDLPPLTAIEGEINQVLVNLIVNAGQAIAELQSADLGRITVTTGFTETEILISVADTGIGIPAERHRKIFELFYTTKPPGTGTGQGLAVSSAIVRRHGGTIAVSSEPGAGARFEVRLPRVLAGDATVGGVEAVGAA